ncbi:hypothetical protein SAMN02910368_02381 [Lachnospiraceae bacterium G11]|nr:hypothetical protein SAMN02910368_02381 [Lachnospiraceae bacterium G11]
MEKKIRKMPCENEDKKSTVQIQNFENKLNVSDEEEDNGISYEITFGERE